LTVIILQRIHADRQKNFLKPTNDDEMENHTQPVGIQFLFSMAIFDARNRF